MKRVSVDKERNAAVLTFNEDLYPQELINKSISDFKEVCDVKFEDKNLVLKPKTKDVNIENLGYEFYNYLLGLIKSQ